MCRLDSVVVVVVEDTTICDTVVSLCWLCLQSVCVVCIMCVLAG